MYKLRLNKNHDALLFSISEDEFNAWITQIDDVLIRIKHVPNSKDDIKTLKKARNFLTTKSCFNKTLAEADCFLPIYEFEVLMHFLTFDLPTTTGKSSPFELASKSLITKKKR